MAKSGKETQQYLSEYQVLKRMNRSQERLVEVLKKELYTLPASSMEVGGGGIGDPTASKILRLDTEERILKQMRVMLSWRGSMINLYLSSVNDPLVKLLIYQRYIVGLTWKQLAVRYGAGQSESSMRMQVVRYTETHPISWTM